MLGDVVVDLAGGGVGQALATAVGGGGDGGTTVGARNDFEACVVDGHGWDGGEVRRTDLSAAGRTHCLQCISAPLRVTE